MGQSSIEWTGYTWNPIKARLRIDTPSPTKANPLRVIPAGKIGYHCERISSGCCNCYACTGNARTLPAWGTGLDYTVPNRDKVEIFLDEDALTLPLRWKRPRKIFVCSMTDWAADFVTDGMMDRILAVAALCSQHEFQFLTKRADRLSAHMNDGHLIDYVAQQAAELGKLKPNSIGTPAITYKAMLRESWPLRNCWIGFSAEDQPNFDARWQHMRKLAAAGWLVWVSLEPLLGPINAAPAICRAHGLAGLRWGVVGGESGSGARPSDLAWYRSLIGQFAAAGAPLFVKQLGAKPFEAQIRYACEEDPRKGGNPDDWPRDLRVRQFPEVRA